jgi:hypothetical protein
MKIGKKQAAEMPKISVKSKKIAKEAKKRTKSHNAARF